MTQTERTEQETYLPYRPVTHDDCMFCGSHGYLCEDYRSGDLRCIDRQACESRRPKGIDTMTLHIEGHRWFQKTYGNTEP